MPNAKPDFQETKRSGHKTTKEGESFTRSDVMTAHSLTLEKISAHGAHVEPNTIPAALVMESQQLNNKRNQPSMTIDIHPKNTTISEQGISSYTKRLFLELWHSTVDSNAVNERKPLLRAYTPLLRN